LNFKHIDGALYFLAVDDLVNGSGRRATTNFNRIYRNHPNGLYWSHAAWMLAYEAYKRKDYNEAERYVREILRHPPDIVVLDRVLYLQGELALKRNDFETALVAFREVGKLCADSPLAVHAMRNAALAASRTSRIN
jgi:outer membrane protein assembly factor BamD (BamD/ComL family)